MSEEKKPGIADLAKAYATAWAEVQNVVKNAHNPHFKSNYADLSAVIDVIKPVFAKHGLVLLQSPGTVTEVGGMLVQNLTGALIHTSGQNIPMNMSVPIGASPAVTVNAPVELDKFGKPRSKGTPDAQKSVAAVSYMRRIQLAAVGGIAQVDDDGNAVADHSTPEAEKVDLSGLQARIKACTDLSTLNGAGKGKGKGLVKSELRLEVETADDKVTTDLFVSKREELKKAKEA